MQDFDILSLLVFSPIVGALLLWGARSLALTRMIALATSLFSLVLSLMLLSGYEASNGGFQFVEKTSWIPSLNIHYQLGIDGISILFLPLTALLFIAVIISSWTSMNAMPRLYYSLLLILQTALLGVFSALDTMLFFFFWELSLIPIYFLVSLWGVGPNRRYAAVKYTLFMLAGGVPLLFGFIVLAFNAADASGTAQLSFDYLQLLDTPISTETQTIVFLLLLLGFGAKAPIFPFHTWLPTIAMEGPVSIAAIMTGLKLGVYGFIRFMVPLAPEAAVNFHWLLAGLGVIGILYGAVVAMNQSNLRRMLAYSSISHVGLVILGIASFNIQGIQGAVYQLLNFTIISGGIFLVVGFLHHRIGSTETLNLGGIVNSMPLLTGFYFLFMLANMGVPGTNGFIAEFMILLSALETHTGAGLAALLGIVLVASFFLTMYRRAFLGPVRRDVIAESIDLLPRELGLVLILSALLLFTGLFPAYILDITRQAAELWLQRLPAASS
ncbi:MAG: NADH-quinone oxidoreductase subunit M [Gammaproteobacteria bacterium]|nr:NADH-quinone oxidoreductase subunit M [Gammaproteobacteria bacterium]